ncbi:TPA: hypothetical protein VJS59_001587 [Streptococcus pyogenes]|nr:hypothetical protein [Streptococcus pyogenes]HER2169415.1 hypothetical protein [Streptococcus pyogenes]HER2174371.1 hypothetical protein [Streptococcus pyogenes]HER2176189.1 hypothetical protein [Streptococcus pyogenes]HER2177943.1 hypothetical protein [Streptococcus pyogenes]
MIQPVSLNELGNFLNLIIHGFDDYIFITFTLMIVFSIAMFMKTLVSGSR